MFIEAWPAGGVRASPTMTPREFIPVAEASQTCACAPVRTAAMSAMSANVAQVVLREQERRLEFALPAR